MSSLSTHVLDTSLGAPGIGILVTLAALTADQATPVADGVTNEDGRIAALLADGDAGPYRLTYHLDGYRGADRLYPFVEVDVVLDAGRHHHVVLTLSPHGYFVACVPS